jgi:uncharacterized membrane-anchored protein
MSFPPLAAARGRARRTALLLLALAAAALPPARANASEPPAAVAAAAPSEGNAAPEIPRTLAVSLVEGEAAKAKLTQMTDAQVFELLRAEPTALGAEDALIRTALEKAFFEQGLDYKTGDVTVGQNLATLHLGQEFRYLSEADAEKVLVEAWGNPPGSKALGLIVPSELSPLHERGWAVVVTYSEEGHVDDEDAEDLDYGELLEEMKKDTEESNAERKTAGYAPIHLVGWAEPPHYDGQAHHLYWAKELQFEGNDKNTLNYAIRFLGRKGVLEFNAVGGIDQLAPIKGAMAGLLPRATFQVGSRYSDFLPDVDQVATYGIGGLIAGKVLAKVGILAGLLKLLIAFKKILILGAIGAFAAIGNLFKRKSNVPSPALASEPEAKPNSELPGPPSP